MVQIHSERKKYSENLLGQKLGHHVQVCSTKKVCTKRHSTMLCSTSWLRSQHFQCCSGKKLLRGSNPLQSTKNGYKQIDIVKKLKCSKSAISEIVNNIKCCC